MAETGRIGASEPLPSFSPIPLKRRRQGEISSEDEKAARSRPPWPSPRARPRLRAAPAPAPSAPPPPPRLRAAPDANPALWVVRDADTTIYLFGTFHLLDGRPWFNDEVRTAFDASDELVMEAILPEDPASLQPMIMRYAVDPAGPQALRPADRRAECGAGPRADGRSACRRPRSTGSSPGSCR